MTPDFIFIVGVAKAGTTALAGWLVRSGLATYAVPGVKEPGSYLKTASSFFPPYPPAPGGLPLLDATPAYFGNARVAARLPEHGARIAVCLRNPLERAWSDYRMKKLLALQGAGADRFIERLHEAAGGACPTSEAWHQQRLDAVLHTLPRTASRQLEQHFDAESRRLVEDRFGERLDYELAFFASRHVFPHQPVLRFSFYYQGLRLLLDRYQPEDIVVLTRQGLADTGRRTEIALRLAGRGLAGEAPGRSFTLSDIALDEPEPDFAGAEFDGLRRMFAFDLDHSLELLESRGVATNLLDRDELYRHIR
ncbi:hypothetical protein STPYR_11016 [uncultured Stenotrophomonas sp.]|uniref:Sulfotransferase n=1 Tax=uncultured Stenotrophomonas sp. TaxID=165438 RepID=A0A1Y5Q5C9_9GAMM|nr:hypothetical protein STPYR_11016 [uncultured Stenotrophomonas sp.]